MISCPPGGVDDYEIPKLRDFLETVRSETVNDTFVFEEKYTMCPLAIGIANSWPGPGTDLVRDFIKMGADVNWVQPETGYSIFQYACWYLDSVESLKMLFDAGADIHHKNKSGETALDMVKAAVKVHCGLAETLEFLSSLY